MKITATLDCEVTRLVYMLFSLYTLTYMHGDDCVDTVVAEPPLYMYGDGTGNTVKAHGAEFK